jgi:predicted phosphodiesterase
MRILLISDIHGNYPALQAIDRQLDAASFDYIVNPGDSLVYAPFPNETLAWLAKHRQESHQTAFGKVFQKTRESG